MLVGKDLGPYLVEKELGSGAMGTVFRAKSKKSGDHVAIKLMSLALGSSQTALNRFVREVAILKQLDHPNITKYKGSGRYHGSPFYIMEYVEGESLDRILARRKRIAWEEVVEIGIHLCAALQHAHDKGIIHRDLKPSNLMILKDGTVKLTDFGIAKDTDVTALTAANSTVGTAAYMSPEQCRGVRDITHKTDLYSMGIMFYELLTGRKPFTGETAMEVFLQHANKTDYKRPTEIVLEIPIWLDTLVCQLMEKEPAKRPLSANAVADALRLIKEKIETQRSAGVDAATKRRIDRAGGDKKLDEEDKEAARAMLGKKKKKQLQPFYTRGWFTIASLAVVVAAGITGAYFVLRTPSAETLYAQAETLMNSSSEQDRKRAREEPIADFLKHYPDHEKRSRVIAMADRYDFETLEKQMHNRRHSALQFKLSDEEQAFRKALDFEEDGRLDEAAKIWTELSAKKGNADGEQHAWGLLGERYAQNVQAVKDRYQKLLEQVKENPSKTAESANEHEKAALDAIRAEFAGKDADRKWDDLKKATESEAQNRNWRLLAAWRWREGKKN